MAIAFSGAAAALPGCEDGLEPVPFQGVTGTVTFMGTPPDSTEWVRLAVYQTLPAAESDLLFGLAGFSDALPLGPDPVDYHLALPAGRYEWLPGVWKKVGAPLGAASLRVAGWHTAAGAGPFDAPEPFQVEPDRETAGVDLVVDFDRLMTPDEALEAIR